MDTIRLFGHHIQSRTLMLGVFQLMLLLGAVYAAAYLIPGVGDLSISFVALLPEALAFALIVMMCMISLGLYQVRLRDGRLRMLLRIFVSFALSAVALMAMVAVFPGLYPGPGVFEVSGVLALIGLGATHVLFFDMVEQGVLKRRVLLFGAGENAASLLSKLRRKTDQRLFTLMGCAAVPEEAEVIDASRLVNMDCTLLEYVQQHRIDEVVIAMDDRRGKFPTEDLLACRLAGVEVTDMLSFYERHTGKVKCDLLQPSWIIFSDGFRRGGVREAVKRALDLLIAVPMLLVAGPIILGAALAIKIEDGIRAPVFYRQRRVGQGGRMFEIVKMRSMRTDAEKLGRAQWASADDPRVTRVGATLRKYRIDELPQLFNVLRGEMSLVGPRPERPEFVEDLERELQYYSVRHRMKPGITGWAQLCYPYGSSEEDSLQKLQYDLYYVKNGSLFLDLVILLGTVEVILFGKGAR
jgi:sugar transferase (PEP-CTERM system associated)